MPANHYHARTVEIIPPLPRLQAIDILSDVATLIERGLWEAAIPDQSHALLIADCIRIVLNDKR